MWYAVLFVKSPYWKRNLDIQLKGLNSEVIWLLEENGIVHPEVFLQRDYTGSTSSHSNVCDECFFLRQFTYKSRKASSWETLVTTAKMLFSEKIQLRKQECLFLGNFSYKNKNACCLETPFTTVRILFPEKLYVQEQECFFLRKYTYKSQNTCSWETSVTRARILFREVLYVNEQECSFLRNVSYESKNALSE
jgi:hypothetical protein